MDLCLGHLCIVVISCAMLLPWTLAVLVYVPAARLVVHCLGADGCHVSLG